MNHLSCVDAAGFAGQHSKHARPALLAAALAVATSLAACGGTSDRASDAVEVVHAAVAASMRVPFAKLASEFEAANPGVTVTGSYLASGTAFHQIRAGAPFQLFVSADTTYPSRLVQDGLADSTSFLVYARGELVLWTSSRLTPEPGTTTSLGAITSRPFSIPNDALRISIANPDVAPYGRAAREVLHALGITNRTIVQGEDVAQAAQLAVTAADAALIPMSLALLPAMQESGNVWAIPDTLYQPVLHAAVAVRGASEPAKALLRFLASERAAAVMGKYGYRVP